MTEATESTIEIRSNDKLPLEEKINKVILEITGKEFYYRYSHKYEAIVNSKEVRDEICTQNYSLNLPAIFNYNNTIFHCRDYINYYSSDLFEACSFEKKLITNW